MFGRKGLSLGRIFGIELVLDWGLFGLVLLIAVSLGFGLMPQWHADWSPVMVWVVSLVAAIGLLASVLVHELSHSLVAKAYGLRVPRITLFLFGGAANLRDEPESPSSELVIAAVGPLTSVVVGIVSLVVAGFLAPDVLRSATEHPKEAFSAAGPVATILFWLGPVNLVLAVFNMLPGFPLDGGRVFRALLWMGTGDYLKATRGASDGGRFLSWALIGAGVLMAFGVPVPFLGAGLVPGLWIVLIGWFLNRSARLSYMQALLTYRLRDISIAELMHEEVHPISGDQSLQDVVSHEIPRSEGGLLPVTDGEGRLIGMLRLEGLQRYPRDRWTQIQVGQAMEPIGDTEKAELTESATEGLQKLASSAAHRLPIVDATGHLRGVLREEDVVRYAMLSG